jgi:uncharacterized membrane protein YkoI
MRILPILAAALILPSLAPAAHAQRGRDQDMAFQAMRERQILPLRDIEARVLDKMKGARYLGPELIGDRYRLKFMRDNRVIWIDVDARTGRFLGKSGD